MKKEDAKVGMKVVVNTNNTLGTHLTDLNSPYLKLGDIITIEHLSAQGSKNPPFDLCIEWGRNDLRNCQWYLPVEWVEPLEDIVKMKSAPVAPSKKKCECTHSFLHFGCKCGGE